MRCAGETEGDGSGRAKVKWENRLVRSTGNGIFIGNIKKTEVARKNCQFWYAFCGAFYNEFSLTGGGRQGLYFEKDIEEVLLVTVCGSRSFVTC